jgi:hypothetical protein
VYYLWLILFKKWASVMVVILIKILTIKYHTGI